MLSVFLLLIAAILTYVSWFIWNDSYMQHVIFRYFDAPFKNKYITSMSGMLSLMYVQSLFQFGAKVAKWEGYYGE